MINITRVAMLEKGKNTETQLLKVDIHPDDSLPDGEQKIEFDPVGADGKHCWTYNPTTGDIPKWVSFEKVYEQEQAGTPSSNDIAVYGVVDEANKCIHTSTENGKYYAHVVIDGTPPGLGTSLSVYFIFRIGREQSIAK